MISCKQATELMSQGLDRQLTLSERLGLRLHLLMCVGCRNTQKHLRFLRQAIRMHPWKL
ncbi:MAG: zf-HC2 domain-containing protein [Sterolibacterium sp.]|jgi:hypothetical protein